MPFSPIDARVGEPLVERRRASKASNTPAPPQAQGGQQRRPWRPLLGGFSASPWRPRRRFILWLNPRRQDTRRQSVGRYRPRPRSTGTGWHGARRHGTWRHHSRWHSSWREHPRGNGARGRHHPLWHGALAWAAKGTCPRGHRHAIGPLPEPLLGPSAWRPLTWTALPAPPPRIHLITTGSLRSHPWQEWIDSSS
jgi:hypothetical protein